MPAGSTRRFQVPESEDNLPTFAADAVNREAVIALPPLNRADAFPEDVAISFQPFRRASPVAAAVASTEGSVDTLQRVPQPSSDFKTCDAASREHPRQRDWYCAPPPQQLVSWLNGLATAASYCDDRQVAFSCPRLPLGSAARVECLGQL